MLNIQMPSCKSNNGVVSEPPSETLTPPKFTLEFVSEEFTIFDKVLLPPLIVLFVSVSVELIVGKVTSEPFVPAANPSICQSYII